VTSNETLTPGIRTQRSPHEPSSISLRKGTKQK
jgi:hypothetical protein